MLRICLSLTQMQACWHSHYSLIASSITICFSWRNVKVSHYFGSLTAGCFSVTAAVFSRFRSGLFSGLIPDCIKFWSLVKNDISRAQVLIFKFHKVTHLSEMETNYNICIQNFTRNWQRKTFENRCTFAKIMTKKSSILFLFERQCI